jgi:hypothetical protein
MTELSLDEIEAVDGGELSVNQVVVYTIIGAAGVATGGTAAIAGGFLLAMTGYLATS